MLIEALLRSYFRAVSGRVRILGFGAAAADTTAGGGGGAMRGLPRRRRLLEDTDLTVEFEMEVAALALC